LVPLAGGIVMPGVHDAAPGLLLQLAPMLPPDGAQFEPLQQTGTCDGGCVVHVNPGAQPPIESQRQPCSPTRQVEGPPAPELLPLPDPELPENPPELEAPPLPDPEAPEDVPELEPPLPPAFVPLLPPHAPAVTAAQIPRASSIEGSRRMPVCLLMMTSSNRDPGNAGSHGSAGRSTPRFHVRAQEGPLEAYALRAPRVARVRVAANWHLVRAVATIADADSDGQSCNRDCLGPIPRCAGEFHHAPL
jgi:hypothetical protein